MQISRTIAVLGGGIGGIVAANELRRLLPKEHRIVVVERDQYHAFASSFLWVMAGSRTSPQVRRPLASLLRSGIEIITAEATKIDLQQTVVETDHASIKYDFLIVALGADLAVDAIPGLREAAHSFYSLEGADKLHSALQNCPPGQLSIVVTSTPYKCPGAPLEGAMLIADLLSKSGRRGQVEVAIYTPEPQPMPVAGPALGQAAVEMLSSRGIKYHPMHRLVSIDPLVRQITFEGKGVVSYCLLVAIPPHRCPAVITNSGLAGDGGWIPVDRKTLRTKVKNVYAIGDVTSIPLPGRFKPDAPLALPKAGVFAHAQGLVVTHQIIADILGREANVTFCGDGYCMLEAGEELAGFAYGNFFAEPAPDVRLKRIGKAWHLGKVLFERMWLSPPGWRKSAYSKLIATGAKILNVPAATS